MCGSQFSQRWTNGPCGTAQHGGERHSVSLEAGKLPSGFLCLSLGISGNGELLGERGHALVNGGVSWEGKGRDLLSEK